MTAALSVLSWIGTILLSLIILAITTVYYMYFTFPSTPIPGPKGHWLMGSLPAMKKAGQEGRYHELFLSWTAEFGKIFRLHIPFKGGLTLCISDGESLHRIYSDTESFTLSPGYRRALSTFAPLSIAVNSGEYWKTHRKVVVSAFAPTQLQYACSVIQDKTDILIKKWCEKREKINVSEDFSKLTLDIIGLVSFDYDFDTLNKGNPWAESLQKISKGIGLRIMTPKFLWRFICSDFKEYPTLVSKLRDLPREILEKRRNQSSENLSRDLLSRLIEARKTGEFSSDDELIDEILLFFYSGHETSANTLSSVFHLIGDKPEIQKQLKQEADQFFADNTDVYSSLANLKFTEAVIKETLRLMPTVPISGRYCVKESKILGYNVYPGTMLQLNIMGVHHDAQNFPDPEKFLPERWLEGKSYHYYPFGDGPKICVGQKLGMIELKLALAKLMQAFEFSMVANQQVDSVHTTTLGPKGGLFINVTNH